MINRANLTSQPKAVWISRFHRDTTEDEITSYIKSSLGITTVDQFQVRKLVKKDCDISAYSFVSFKVVCSVELFDTLMNPANWPTTCLIREFEMEIRGSPVAKIQASPVKSASKNEIQNVKASALLMDLQ